MGAGGHCELGHWLWPPRTSCSLCRRCLLQQVANQRGEPGHLLLSTGLPHRTTVFADPVTPCGRADHCVSSHPLSEPLPFLPVPSQCPFFKFRLGSLSLESHGEMCQGSERLQSALAWCSSGRPWPHCSWAVPCLAGMKVDPFQLEDKLACQESDSDRREDFIRGAARARPDSGLRALTSDSIILELAWWSLRERERTFSVLTITVLSLYLWFCEVTFLVECNLQPCSKIKWNLKIIKKIYEQISLFLLKNFPL